MKPNPASQARKRPVNLTLSDDLVQDARRLTNNLSGIVESLLTDYVAQERAKISSRATRAAAAATAWNAFNDKFGAFADEHSTL